MPGRHLYDTLAQRVTSLLAFIALFVVFLTAVADRCDRSPSPIPLHVQESTPADPSPVLSAAVQYAREVRPAYVAKVPALRSADLLGSGCPVPTRTTVGGGWARLNPPPEPTRAEVSRNLRIIALVAREMGVSPKTARVLQHWAVRESGGFRFQLHLMRGDVRAASSAKARARVLAMGREWGPEWTYGRGWYGMQPSYFMARWPADAPLDVLCDPVASTVTAIWAARAHQRECVRAGWSPSLLVSSRRWASGHCYPREKDDRAVAYWHRRSVNVYDRAKWGTRLPQGDHVRTLTYLREKAREAGLDTPAQVL